MMDDTSAINLQNYPITNSANDRYRELVARARSRLAIDGALELADFLTPAATTAMLKMAFGLKFRSHHMQGMFPAYSDALGDDDDKSLPVDHPSRVRLPASHHFIPGDLIDAESELGRLYRSPDFIAFLSDVLEVSPLYPLADPLGRLNVLIYEPGDCNGWHFDTNNFVISLVLQNAEQGGDYQYRPNLRSDEDPNLLEVSRQMRYPDDTHDALTAELAPGTLFLFCGKNTLHRVTEVRGDQERVVSIMSYHQTPTHLLSDSSKRTMYGRVA